MFQIPVSVFEDKMNLSKKKATGIITIASIMVGLPSALSYSSFDLRLFQQPIFDIFDSIVETLGLVISATVFLNAITWFIHKKKNDGASKPV